eukprot:scaffold169439_cov28-Cyclotella_meneghiniana.AAC.1
MQDGVLLVQVFLKRTMMGYCYWWCNDQTFQSFQVGRGWDGYKFFPMLPLCRLAEGFKDTEELDTTVEYILSVVACIALCGMVKQDDAVSSILPVL